MDQVELPPGSCVELLSDTEVVVQSLITTPAASLVTVNTQCSGARQGAASTGCFSLAPRKCCVEKMAAGKCRAESAAKINLSFVDTHALQWSGTAWGRSCSSGAAGWDAPERLAKAPACLQDEPGTPCACSRADTGHPDIVTAVTDPLTAPVSALQALLAGMESLPFGMEFILQLCVSSPSTSSSPESPTGTVPVLESTSWLCCVACAGWPVFPDTLCFFLPRTHRITITNFCLGKHLVSEDDLLKDQRGSPAYISPDVLSGRNFPQPHLNTHFTLLCLLTINKTTCCVPI